MSDTTVSFDEAAAERRDAQARGIDRSTIEFPYLDLEAGIDVARAIYERAGLGVCEIDELAAQMQQTVSGAFRLKTATAKIFGLVDKEGRSSFRLSTLGQRIVHTDTETEARATAFLSVPLYKAVFDRYRGHLLPPAKALEREMGSFGVTPKQTDKARQAFERSARQAGFFAQGEDRLVQPRFEPAATLPLASKANEDSAKEPPKGGNGGGGPPDNRPLEYQLIDLLKRPEIGESERTAIWTLVQFLAGTGAQK